jgi:hypothetical protein
MARPRFQNADPLKQDAILQAAAKEFAQVGYEGASLNRILLVAGVARAPSTTLRRQGRPRLHRAGLGVSRPSRRLRPDRGSRRRHAVLGAIHRFSRESLAMLDRIPYANDLLSRLSHAFVNDKALEARALQVLGHFSSIWMTLITRGQQLGVVRSDVPARTLIGIFQGIKEALLRDYTVNDHILTKDELEQLANLQIDLFRRVCAPGVQGGR